MPGYYQGLLSARTQLEELENKKQARGLLGLRAQGAQRDLADYDERAPLRAANREAEIIEAKQRGPTADLAKRKSALDLIQKAKQLFTSVGDPDQLAQANEQFEQLTGRPSPYANRPFTPDFQDRVMNDLSSIEQRIAAKTAGQGALSPGYRRTAGGMEPVPGGPQDPETQARSAAAKLDAKSRVQLPEAVRSGEQMLRHIDEMIGSESGDIKPHAGFQGVVGATWKPGMRFWPGSKEADFQRRLDQVKGGVFMEAYKTLKGGGQITEVEGEKATAALNRMDRSQSEEEFIAAAREFQGVVLRGLAKAKEQLRRGAMPGQSAGARGGARAGWSVKEF